jgi:hypothetical protein
MRVALVGTLPVALVGTLPAALGWDRATTATLAAYQALHDQHGNRQVR